MRDLFTKNLGYKLVALLVALLLWYDVTSDETTVIDYPVPLRVAVEGPDMIITNEIPGEVEVSFSGTGKELLRLDKDQLSIQKEVPGGENDTTQVTIELRDVRRPTDLNVIPIAISPGQVAVVTDRFIEKSVLLEPVGLPVTEEGFQIVNVEVEPRRVQVRGVTAEVRPIGSLALDLAQVTRIAGAFDEVLEIAVPESLRTVTVTPDSVRIRGTVVEVSPIELAE
jgi:YbbR domain-containing protein